jgi:hypothetical protein
MRMSTRANRSQERCPKRPTAKHRLAAASASPRTSSTHDVELHAVPLHCSVQRPPALSSRGPRRPLEQCSLVARRGTKAKSLLPAEQSISDVVSLTECPGRRQQPQARRHGPLRRVVTVRSDPSYSPPSGKAWRRGVDTAATVPGQRGAEAVNGVAFFPLMKGVFSAASGPHGGVRPVWR